LISGSSITVPTGKTLTIEPGAIVKISGMSLTVNGTLTAAGTAGNQIYFTSLKDDTIGGDTNGDGNTTTPAARDWNRFSFGASSVNNVLDYAVIRYGGASEYGAFEIRTSSLTVSNSVIENNGYDGLWIYYVSPTVTGCTIRNNGKDGLNAYSSKGIFTGNTIENNIAGYGLDLPDSVNATVENNTFSGNKYNNAILIYGTLDGDRTWQTGMTYLVSGGAVTVPQGKKLTINPGTIVKFASGQQMSVSGTLIADGTVENKIYFTSYRDDAVGGDTNGDGDATTPGAGDWSRLYFNTTSTNNFLDYNEIRYGGSGSYPLVQIQTSSIKIRNSTIEHSTWMGVHVYNASPSFAGNRIRNCQYYGVYLQSSNPSLFKFNAVMNNTPEGLHNDSTTMVNAENNYWGHETGPLDASDDRAAGGLYNPTGQGNAISNYADYDPWLKSDPYIAYLSYLHNGILLLQMMTGMDVGDISYIEDLDKNGVLGLPEASDIFRKASQTR
jgi:hypothetical protein